MKLDIFSRHIKLSKNQTEYIKDKLGSVDKYLPPTHAKSTRAEVKLRDGWLKKIKQMEIELRVYLPGKVLVIRQKAYGLTEAVNQARAKLKISLEKYKARHSDNRTQRRLTMRRSRDLV